MRDLNKLDDMMQAIAEAETPVKTILADKEVETLWRGGSYLDMIFYLMREHRAEIHAVISAVDGELTPEEVAEQYTITQTITLLRGIMEDKGVRETIALFGAAGRKRGAVSSGSATENTGA